MINKIPKGYTSITPYIMFHDVKKAIDFYEQAFNAKKIACMVNDNGQVQHAEIQIGNAIIMMSEPSEMNGNKKPIDEYKEPSPLFFYFYVDNANEVLTQSLKSGAKQMGKLVDTLWGDRMVSVLDPFGIQWTISERILEHSLENIEKTTGTKNT